MSALTLRCPNCGSVQDADGPCETCHEADVRLFCPNHTPGRWLDAPPCGACGATLDAGPVAAPAPPRRPPPMRMPRIDAPAPPRRPLPERPVAPPPASTRRPEVLADEADAPIVFRPPRPVDPGAILRPAVRVALPSFLGCVGRLAMVVVFLLALLLAGFVYVVWY